MWKWTLGVLGIGVVALALTIPNGAVELSKYELAQDCVVTPKQVHECLGELNANEKATLKGKEIARQVKSVAKQNVKFSGADYDIQITETRAIENGVEIFARVWTPDGKQVGFGKDGSIDIERFVFINPPILVSDPNGDIIREWTDESGELKQRKLRESPQEAILQSLAHTISVKKQKFGSNKIIRGKVGNTTTTVYPDPDPESTSVDGFAGRIGVDETFATIRAGAGTSSSETDVTIQLYRVRTSSTDPQYDRLGRSFALFDASAIGDTDTISSAIFSLNISAKSDTLGGGASVNSKMNIVDGTPDSNTAIANADYDNVGTTQFGQSNIFDSLAAIGSYEDITITDLTKISKTGITKFGIRSGWDLDNTVTGFTWSAAVTILPESHAADAAGTTSDPKLVIEHEAGVSAKPRRIIID